MESRACYGYYGELGGASGERKPKAYRGGYNINTYYFLVDWHIPGISSETEIKAKTFRNAERRVKEWAKRDGGTFIGENPKYTRINHYWEAEQ